MNHLLPNNWKKLKLNNDKDNNALHFHPNSLSMINNNKTLRIIHWNTNGVKQKTSVLKTLLYSKRIDIALLKETRIKPSALLKMPN